MSSSGSQGWRYFPELLRGLERVPGKPGAECSMCDGATEVLRSRRAELAWCPRCRILEVRSAAGVRALGVFSEVHRPHVGVPEDHATVEPSDVPRVAPHRAASG